MVDFGLFKLRAFTAANVAGPVSGAVSDRIGSRGLATAGAAASGAAFIGLMLLPVDFPYLVFALLLLGINPLQHLLSSHDALHYLSAAERRALTGCAFFPHLISMPFHAGLVVVFASSAGLSAIAALASLLRGGRPAAATAPGYGSGEEAT
jgi:hypothetical protein